MSNQLTAAAEAAGLGGRKKLATGEFDDMTLVSASLLLSRPSWYFVDDLLC